MPARLTQIRARLDYANAIGFDVSDGRKYYGGNLIQLYNIPVGRWPWMLHRFYQEREEINTVRWGFEPPVDGARMHTTVDIEYAMTERYFRHMWKDGRCVVPVDGFHEFPEDGSDPWYVRLRTGATMLCAAISSFRPYKLNPPPGTGFCFVTAGQRGFRNPRDLVPVMLTPEAARAWVNPAIGASEAATLLESQGFDPDAFHVYRVSKRVFSVSENDEGLIEPV
jgi:putative SOS response-associated peptidase YedK